MATRGQGLKHHPWDDNALADLRDLVGQKSIKTACGRRVAIASVCRVEGDVTCEGCRTWLAKRDDAHALIKSSGALPSRS